MFRQACKGLDTMIAGYKYIPVLSEVVKRLQSLKALQMAVLYQQEAYY